MTYKDKNNREKTVEQTFTLNDCGTKSETSSTSGGGNGGSGTTTGGSGGKPSN